MTPDIPRPRLWVVTECYPTPRGPNHCAFVHRQLAALGRLGWDVRVLLPNGWFPPLFWRLAPAWRAARQRHIPASWHPDGVAVSDLVHQNRVPSRLSRPISTAARIGNALTSTLAGSFAEPDRDLVLCVFALPFGPPVAAACRRLGLRYAVYLFGDDVWVWPHNSTDRLGDFARTLREAALALGVSQALLSEAGRLAEVQLARAVVVPSGIDLERFRPVDAAGRLAARASLGIGEHAIVVLCVATSIARKGWRELLRALGSLQHRGIVLLAVTSGLGADLDLDKEHEALAASLKCVFLRDVPSEAMSPCYAASDIFCLPSYGEGMSNAVLEAMASGLAVVTTPVGGHPEVITNGVDGYLVPPREVEPLRRIVESLVIDASRRQRLGVAARRRAERIGTPDSTAKRLDSLFSAVLDGSIPASLEPTSPYQSASQGDG